MKGDSYISVIHCSVQSLLDILTGALRSFCWLNRLIRKNTNEPQLSEKVHFYLPYKSFRNTCCRGLYEYGEQFHDLQQSVLLSAWCGSELWNATLEQRRIHWIVWASVCFDRQQNNSVTSWWSATDPHNASENLALLRILLFVGGGICGSSEDLQWPCLVSRVLRITWRSFLLF